MSWSSFFIIWEPAVQSKSSHVTLNSTGEGCNIIPAKQQETLTGVLQCVFLKYLGLSLDETLNWNKDVNELCKSLIKYFGIFNHIKYKIIPAVMRQLYYAFIYARIKYGIELYGSSSASNMNKVQVIQNKL